MQMGVMKQVLAAYDKAMTMYTITATKL